MQLWIYIYNQYKALFNGLGYYIIRNSEHMTLRFGYVLTDKMEERFNGLEVVIISNTEALFIDLGYVFIYTLDAVLREI